MVTSPSGEGGTRRSEFADEIARLHEAEEQAATGGPVTGTFSGLPTRRGRRP
ncbi:hypothetical protein [Streptomyces wuyuanensis]|uniref:hypothetical protein n=1 Tax=Streptomyces wuyuanensis TaxID=1196353 RepID=UPI003D70D78D